MNKIKIVKTSLNVLSQLGAGRILYSVVRNNVPTTNTYQKVTVGVATFALGGAVANLAATNMDQVVDEIVDMIETFKSEDPS